MPGFVNAWEEGSKRWVGVEGDVRVGFRSFTVLLDGVDFRTAPTVARFAPGIPRYNDPFDTDETMFLKGVSSKAVGKSTTLFRISLRYRSLQAEATPFDAPWEVSWSSDESQQAVDDDVVGQPIVNRAGDPFNPPHTIDHADPVLTITRNERAVEARTLELFANTVNSDPFIGLEAGQCLMKPILAVRSTQENFIFWRVTYVIHIRIPRNVTPGLAWYARILNTGLRARTEVGGEPEVAKDTKGQPFSEPILLDESGLALSDERIKAGNVVWLLFQDYKTAPFGLLQLDNF